MKKVLLDASSAILLFKAGLLKELTESYHVDLSVTVFRELTEYNRPGADKFLHYVSTKKIRVIEPWSLQGHQKLEAPVHFLDRGEADTIKCFAVGNHDFIITDDGQAARYCRKQCIPFINGLLFPRLLYVANRMSEQECRDKMGELTGLGRYSAEVIEWAVTCWQDAEFAVPGDGQKQN